MRWREHYDPNVPHTIDFEERTLVDDLVRAAERSPDCPAITFMNARLTYAELKSHVDHMAASLAELGVEKGHAVAIHLPNLPQTVISIYAVLSLGARCVMTNPLYVTREIEHQWNDAGCKVAITADYLFASKIKGHRDELPIEQYIIASIPEMLHFPLSMLATLKLWRMDPPLIARVAPGPGIHFFRDMVKGPTAPPEVEVLPDDVAMIQYTGGTTGVSKGALLTHRNIASNIQQIKAWNTEIEPGQEVVVAALPFFHVFGLVGALFLAVTVDGEIVVVPNPRDIHGLVRALTRSKATMMPAVPPLFAAINNHRGIESVELSHLKFCISGAAPLPVEVAEEFERLTGCALVEGFGMTEVSLTTHANPVLGDRRLGTIGLPLPSTDAKVVDLEDGVTELPPGEEGELIVRGPQVMAGYLNRPEETAAVLQDGWLKTGDIVRMDEDGYFTIVGRKKDLVLSGGYNVFPDEIDEVLLKHESVAEVCSIGIPDERRGEVVKSFLVLQPDAVLDAEVLEAHCREHLAPFKVPAEYEAIDELPRSAVLKLLRRVLRDRELARTARSEGQEAAVS